MEADSTTYDNSPKADISETLPFPTCPGNYKLYKDFSSTNGDGHLQVKIVERMQEFGLLRQFIKCPSAQLECKVISKAARVIDRVQWVCEACGKRQPIRIGSFFLRLQCSILQALQIILAWCEDADYEMAAQYFGVKPRVVSTIYDRLDDLAVREQSKHRLGGDNSVVLAEIYPDCLTGQSPDTTDQPHVHRILMLADTNRIPTAYHLHVIKDDLKKNYNGSSDSKTFVAEVEEVMSRVTVCDATVVTGSTVPLGDGASTMQQLMQYCDIDMQHFLTSRIWRQAISLCVASRDLCAGAANAVCASAVQRYLHTALYRLRHGDGFYEHTLRLLAAEYKERYDNITDNDI